MNHSSFRIFPPFFSSASPPLCSPSFYLLSFPLSAVFRACACTSILGRKGQVQMCGANLMPPPRYWLHLAQSVITEVSEEEGMGGGGAGSFPMFCLRFSTCHHSFGRKRACAFAGRSAAAKTRLFQFNFMETVSVTIEDVFTGTRSLTPPPQSLKTSNRKYSL